MTHRRRVFGIAATLPALALAGPGSRAQQQQRFANLYLFIPANPGGGWDGLGRAVEQVARQAGLVGNVQVENVGGAGGTVGLPRFVAQRRGRPDSLMVAGSVMVGAVLANRSPVGIKDVTPVARMTDDASVVVVPAGSPIRDIGGLLDALKANPGAVSVAGGSAGGTEHIALGQVLRALGRSAREASYIAFSGGGPAQAAVLGAQVTAGISGLSEFGEQIRAGRLRALATTGERRSDPAVPTLREAGVDVVAGTWRGVFGAPAIRPEAREALVRLMAEIHGLPAWQELLRQRGLEDAFLPGAAFEAFLEREQRETEAVLKEIGLV